MSPDTIVVDGVFFQSYCTGIARLWTEVLTRWQRAAIGRRVVLLDRGGFLPAFERLRIVKCPPLDYADWAGDRKVVQAICDDVGAGLFVSTYFTRPERTPSALVIADMIPERLGYDLTHPMWQQKRDAIRHASALACISNSTLADLKEFCPDTAGKPMIVVHCGVDASFQPASKKKMRDFHECFVVPYLGGRPYYLFVGIPESYKNGALLLQALARMAMREPRGVLFTTPSPMTDRFRALPNMLVHATRLSDAALWMAYCGAICLVYPSRYEGFGLPVVEAMACGCPVVCSNTSSLPEVAGDAALMIDPTNPDALAAALAEVSKPELRANLARRGIARARMFSWEKTAAHLESFLVRVAAHITQAWLLLAELPGELAIADLTAITA